MRSSSGVQRHEEPGASLSAETKMTIAAEKDRSSGGRSISAVLENKFDTGLQKVARFIF